MAKPIGEGEAFSGSWGLLKDSNWLNATSIPADRDTVVTIEAVVRRASVKFKDEEKKGYGSLKFREFDKELGLCATHLNVLARLFGSAKEAVGQKVALYVDPDVSAFGKTVAAVRIRPKKIAASAPAAVLSEARKGVYDMLKASPADVKSIATALGLDLSGKKPPEWSEQDVTFLHAHLPSPFGLGESIPEAPSEPGVNG